MTLIRNEPIGTETLDELNYIMANESIVSTISGVKTFFSRILGESETFLLQSISNIESNISDEEIKLTRDKVNFIKKLESLPYNDFRDVLINVPEGFVGDLPGYTEYLVDSWSNQRKIALRGFEDCNLFLSGLLSNPDARKQLKDYKKVAKPLKESRLAYEHEIVKYFQSGSNLTRIPVRKVISRFRDFELILKAAQEMERIDFKKDLSVIKGNVDQIVNLIKLVRVRVDNDEITLSSTELSKDVSESVYELAKQTEMIAMLSYHINVAKTISNHLYMKFKAILG